MLSEIWSSGSNVRTLEQLSPPALAESAQSLAASELWTVPPPGRRRWGHVGGNMDAVFVSSVRRWNEAFLLNIYILRPNHPSWESPPWTSLMLSSSRVLEGLQLSLSAGVRPSRQCFSCRKVLLVAFLMSPASLKRSPLIESCFWSDPAERRLVTCCSISLI